MANHAACCMQSPASAGQGVSRAQGRRWGEDSQGLCELLYNEPTAPGSAQGTTLKLCKIASTISGSGAAHCLCEVYPLTALLVLTYQQGFPQSCPSPPKPTKPKAALKHDLLLAFKEPSNLLLQIEGKPSCLLFTAAFQSRTHVFNCLG